MQTNHTLAKPCQLTANLASHKQVRNLRTSRPIMLPAEFAFGMPFALPSIIPNAFLPATERRRLAYRVHCLESYHPLPL